MYPPSHQYRLDIEAISGILGSVSIACWVVVFSPQIIENFRRSSADGLSLAFLVVWLLGDVFNILGAVLQGVLPTMLILAVYYTFADIVLLLQCFYYRGFSFKEKATVKTNAEEEPTEEAPLLNRNDSPVRPSLGSLADRARRGSSNSFHAQLYAVDGTHLSPAMPLIAPPKATDESPATRNLKSMSAVKATLFNIFALVIVCAAGVLGWWLSTRSVYEGLRLHNSHGQSRGHMDDDYDRHHPEPTNLDFDVLGQVFGYLCAVFYLGSRVPQLLLNYRRKSTEGVSMLFFLFACVGNLTYFLSIFAYEPLCARGEASGATNPYPFYAISARKEHHRLACHDGEWDAQYWRYILVNLSWLIGSAGTLALDGAIFLQFWLYRGREPVDAEGLSNGHIDRE